SSNHRRSFAAAQTATSASALATNCDMSERRLEAIPLQNPATIYRLQRRRNMTHDAAHILSTRQKTGVTAQRSFNAA
ncbi:MAG: hypothetical protein ACK4OI_16370, partial [Rhizobium oryzihabitans]